MILFRLHYITKIRGFYAHAGSDFIAIKTLVEQTMRNSTYEYSFLNNKNEFNILYDSSRKTNSCQNKQFDNCIGFYELFIFTK